MMANLVWKYLQPRFLARVFARLLFWSSALFGLRGQPDIQRVHAAAEAELMFKSLM